MNKINKTIIQQIDQMFPNALFYVAMDLEELDEVVIECQDIIVKQVYDCYCFDDFKKNTEFFTISCNPLKNEKMTNKFIIQELIKQGLNLQECNHHFLEGFVKTKGSDCQLEIVVGS